MPLPTPNKGEPRGKFLLRCMSDSVARNEFPRSEQRYAVCNSQAAKRSETQAASHVEQPEAASRSG